MTYTPWIALLVILATGMTALPLRAQETNMTYEIWETEPAPNRGSDWKIIKARGMPYDEDWEERSYPLGNGYMGACLFGRTDTERVQITEKTLHNKEPYGNGGLTGFADLYLDLNHADVQNYRRSLNLNEAVAHVRYESKGVTHTREYFTSYPDNVLAIRLAADRKAGVSVVVRPEIAYLGREDNRTGKVSVQGDLITLAGTMPFFNTNYEGQIKVLNTGGTLTTDAQKGVIEVRDADSVVILLATGTNYRLSEKIFTSEPAQKCDPNVFPHDEVSARIAAAQQMGYDTLKQRHLADYQQLFGRVSVDFRAKPSPDPTSVLLEKYKKGDANPWLEQLMFQYGRYLLIASSRQKTLPANLQGTWSQYYVTPWSGGYWHNINVQMNYWGAMSANLPECFESYLEFFKAYLPQARIYARNYVEKRNPDRLSDGDNGWILGTGANAYAISGAGMSHSGPGTGGFTSKLLMEYYLYTLDRKYLEEVAYPAMRSMSVFYSKALVRRGDLLLVEPSASPEQRHGGEYYITVGCTFDQAFVWENHNDTLLLAAAIGKDDEFIGQIRKEITQLDPILIGESGQIKEFREEKAYGEIGERNHRHISHLCALYPGSLISSARPDWMQAASKTLDLRGDKTTGWAMAHRMNCRARLKEGEKAYSVYKQFIQERAAPNLWTMHPPFQIDGNFGTMAGVVEMLLQSHEGYIDVLPALPKAWETGSFTGLVARGNFVIDAEWKQGKPTHLTLTSRAGGPCRIAAGEMGAMEIKDANGAAVAFTRADDGVIRFETTKDITYTVVPTR